MRVQVIYASRHGATRGIPTTQHPRDMQVFFGAYDPDAEPIGFAERLGARFTKMATIGSDPVRGTSATGH